MFNVLITLYLILYFSLAVTAGNEVKRGKFPFTGFIYYTDDTVIDSAGNRFIQNVILLHTDWLISSSIEQGVGFPDKTLMARLGALTIDSKMSFSEDEDEQEREIVRIVRPANHDAARPWVTDISLLKTVTPFNSTLAVGTATISLKSYVDKSCIVLLYLKQNQSDSAKALTQLTVDLMQSSKATCGDNFVEDTMACGTVKSDYLSNDYCLGNQGGPLICDDLLVGIQTYSENRCGAPHIYQLVSGWNSFIICGAQDKCLEDVCKGQCQYVDKDEPKMTVLPTPYLGPGGTMTSSNDSLDILTPTLSSSIPRSQESAAEEMPINNETTKVIDTVIVDKIEKTEEKSDQYITESKNVQKSTEVIDESKSQDIETPKLKDEKQNETVLNDEPAKQSDESSKEEVTEKSDEQTEVSTRTFIPIPNVNENKENDTSKLDSTKPDSETKVEEKDDVPKRRFGNPASSEEETIVIGPNPRGDLEKLMSEYHKPTAESVIKSMTTVNEDYFTPTSAEKNNGADNFTTDGTEIYMRSAVSRLYPSVFTGLCFVLANFVVIM